VRNPNERRAAKIITLHRLYFAIRVKEELEIIKNDFSRLGMFSSEDFS